MKSSRIHSFDSLRGIAILSVLFGHVFSLRGGFIGVDVFFVISGFVITLWLINESEQKLSLSKFYRNRIARIIPPLFFATLVAFLLARYVMVDEGDYDKFKTGYLYQTFFLQNYFLLQTESNYFQSIAAAKFNTHLWSIAIEEQFYLLFPICFFLANKWGSTKTLLRNSLALAASYVLLIWCGGLVFESFKNHGWFATLNPDTFTKYYLIEYRAWELLFGGFACVIAGKLQAQNLKPSVWISWLLTVVLLSTLITCFLFLSPEPAWPRASSTVPVVVTSLLMIVLFLNENRKSVLMFWPLMSVGRSSYSLYLLHWPLFAFFLYLNFDFGKGSYDLPVYFLILILLTYLSYKLFEKPRARIRAPLLICVLLSFLSFQLAVFSTSARQLNIPPEIKQNIDSSSPVVAACTKCETTDSFDGDFILLWGDSHAKIYSDELTNYADSHHLKVVSLLCPPISEDCLTGPDYKRALTLSKKRGFKAAILAARWSARLAGGDLYHKPIGNLDPEQSFEKFADDFKGLNFIFVREAPTFAVPPPKEALLEFLPYRFRKISLAPVVLAKHRAEKFKADQLISRIAATFPKAAIVDPTDRLCSSSLCQWRDNEYHLYYFDQDHLSRYGAKLVFPLIAAELDRSLEPRKPSAVNSQ